MTLADPIELLAPREVSRVPARDLHLAWLERLEVAFERVTLRSLKRALRPVTQALGAVTAQGEPAAAGEPFVSVDDLAQVRMLWATQVAEELVPLLADVYLTGSQGVAIAARSVSTQVSELVQVGGQEWLAASAERMRRVGDTAWLTAREELLEGFRRGESIDQLARRVRSATNITAARARTVARTEVIGASNAGSFAEARALGLKTKTWLNTHDARTRPSHARAGGQTVNLDDVFDVGGSQMRFPHDPLAPAGEKVNCRCTLTYDEQPLCACTPAWVQREAGALIAASVPECGCSDDPETVKIQQLAANVISDLGRRGGVEKRAYEAVKHYGGDGFIEINEALRFGDLDRDTARWIQGMDTAFDRGAVRPGRDFIVYRGIGRDHPQLDAFQISGTELVDDGFLSVTVSAQSARNFTDSDGVILEILVPARTPVIGVPDSPEEELILDRGSRLRIRSSRIVDGRTVVGVEIMP